ncbi:hypothetical protein [Arenibaculum pallidiluteum]|uniref:hypothetical protein n=1 Tax=Arenibaculum pallidiluteum TaxID=2812559 RepID=UPI001A966A1C|nr:hypothetical protein [Arenibaculum pallidiluteum]
MFDPAVRQARERVNGLLISGRRPADWTDHDIRALLEIREDLAGRMAQGHAPEGERELHRAMQLVNAMLAAVSARVAKVAAIRLVKGRPSDSPAGPGRSAAAGVATLAEVW